MKEVFRKVLGRDELRASAAAPARARDAARERPRSEHWFQALPDDAVVPRATFDAVAENAAECVLHVDADGAVCEATAAAIAFAGYAVDGLVGVAFEALLHSDDGSAWRDALATVFRSGVGRCNVSFRLRTAAGAYVSMESVLAAYMSLDGRARAVVIARDVSEARAAEARLMQMATRDPLTGLANRALLTERFSHLIAQAKRSGAGFAVLVLDLDGFKKVNDTLGHAVGDELIRAVAKRLVDVVRETDAVARQGGDEFVCLLPGASTTQAVELVAGRILGAIQWPFPLDSHTLHMTTSIGAAIYPTDGTDEATLLKHADRAMYRAKEAGRNTWSLHMQEAEGNTHLLSLEAAMHDAIASGEFLLHYQPIAAAGGRIVGCEALMRWQRGGASGLVAPGEFIPLAESNGLIKILGSWAIRAACAQLAKWGETAPPDFYASVNVSPRQFRQENFVKVVRSALELTGLAPSRLAIEITEGVLMQNPQAAQKIVCELRELGVRIAVDDFGTGYSSLAYLKNFPLSAIKIDRSFVRDVADGGKDGAIVAAVITLARELGMEVVAEGVETEAQRDTLEAKGCPLLQGWLFGRPQDAAAFRSAHLASATPRAAALA